MKWKVSKERIALFPHPNADLLQIGRVGDYQVVVAKEAYNDGDVVVFIPEKSLLAGALREEFKKYLVGVDANRVHSVHLRGALSCGVIVPPRLLPDLSEVALGEDVSDLLGVKQYIPDVPTDLAGGAEPARVDSYGKHDVYHFDSYASDFGAEERVTVTEKIHGTQCSCTLQRDGVSAVMSKGLADSGIAFVAGQSNLYTRTVAANDVFGRLKAMLEDLAAEDSSVAAVQAFGEVIPCQKGFGYGADSPRFVCFRGSVLYGDREEDIPHDDPRNRFHNSWVPVLFDGPFSEARAQLKTLRTGTESLSGRSLHIREGVVVRPHRLRKAADGRWLAVKALNPAYKETGDEFN